MCEGFNPIILLPVVILEIQSDWRWSEVKCDLIGDKNYGISDES
jgi:hypothetical protein